jgi:hypothetical protein
MCQEQTSRHADGFSIAFAPPGKMMQIIAKNLAVASAHR